MTMPDYPFFAPPDHLASKVSHERTPQEAREYFNWFMENRHTRIANFLQYFGENSSECRNWDLKRIGASVAKALYRDPFSEWKDGQRILTNRGYALAADFGLLIADMIQSECSSVQWSLMKRKKDASYNLPVLTGFGKVHLDPVGGSIAEAQALLRGDRDACTWWKIFDHWTKLAKHVASQNM